jgi:hypothetical protein
MVNASSMPIADLGISTSELMGIAKAEFKARSQRFDLLLKWCRLQDSNL